MLKLAAPIILVLAGLFVWPFVEPHIRRWWRARRGSRRRDYVSTRRRSGPQSGTTTTASPFAQDDAPSDEGRPQAYARGRGQF